MALVIDCGSVFSKVVELRNVLRQRDEESLVTMDVTECFGLGKWLVFALVSIRYMLIGLSREGEAKFVWFVFNEGMEELSKLWGS